MADGKIYITITDKRPASDGPIQGAQESNTQGTSGTLSDKSGKTQGSILLRYAEHQFFNFVEAEAKKFVMTTLGNVGNFSGNYAAQDDINVGLSNLSSVMGIGIAAIEGAKIGGPAGAAVGAVIGIATQEINFQMRDKIARLENYKQNKRIEKLRIRSGLDAATNDSRGTNS